MKRAFGLDIVEQRELRRLWSERPAAERTGNGLLIFHGWLQQNRPDLLPRHRSADSYQLLKTLLQVTDDERSKE